MTAMPLESKVSACSRTASCEAASMTTSGRASISLFTPMTKRRAHVLPVDLGADGILSGVEVPEKKVAAGVFDVADDARGRVDAAIVAHEVDDARFVHGDFPRMDEAGPQAGFHFAPSRESSV